MAGLIGDGLLGIVAGSGLSLAPLLDVETDLVPFSALRGVPQPRVAGHGGQFRFGRCGGQDIVLQEGRLHMYEGHDFAGATSTVAALHTFGVRQAILTNATGGLLATMKAGDFVAITQVVLWPCLHWHETEDEWGTDFVVAGCGHMGAYAWVMGPTYETRAEIRALQRSGMAVVGMSAGPELARCKALGIEAAVVSCVTNNCCTAVPLAHADVVATAQNASARLVAMLRHALDAAPETGGQ